MPSQAELFRLLQRHGIPFVIIGGHAVGFHGHLRATEDVDVVWMRSAEIEAKLFSALSAVHAQWIGNEIDPATRIEKTVPVSEAYIRASRLMMLVTDHGFLDLFDYVPGCPDADMAAFYADSIESSGLRYASLPWLQRMKRAANRPQDREDLEHLS